MSYLFINLEIHIKFALISALVLVFIYEAINGFHDTANSVVTVIYTHALRSHIAVFISGIFNFLGVILSGLSVAYTIIHLLPINFLINTTAEHTLVMIFSILLAAIFWNFGTWYFGLPTSSSHTLIGTLIGIGLTNSIITNHSIIHGLNISKLTEIFLSLIISPIIGLILAKLIMLLICCYWDYKKYYNIHMTPMEQEKKYGKRQPKIWLRIILIVSAAGVSFSHGANDGQKGIGLVMILLIGVIPTSFMLNMNSNNYDISRTREAVFCFQKYYAQNHNEFKKIIPSGILSMPIETALNHLNTMIPSVQQDHIKKYLKNNNLISPKNKKFNSNDEIQIKKQLYDLPLNFTIIHNAISLLENLENYKQLNSTQRFQIRQLLIYIADLTDQIATLPELSYTNKKFLKNLKKNLLNTIEYAPTWIIFSIALSLSLGTIIGWKRVATTIGEKIGRKKMTYAQGLSAQLTTAISISIASYYGMPVSTTHVLSSSITGSMLIKGWGVHGKIIKNILITWILTLPISIIASSGFYWLSLTIFKIYI